MRDGEGGGQGERESRRTGRETRRGREGELKRGRGEALERGRKRCQGGRDRERFREGERRGR